jgi:pimeloyl-ACP methyl ester carboxylesterase
MPDAWGRTVEAWALGNLGQLAYEQADYPEARRRYEESLAIWRAAGDRLRSAIVLLHLGDIAEAHAAADVAHARYQESLALAQDLSNERLTFCVEERFTRRPTTEPPADLAGGSLVDVGGYRLYVHREGTRWPGPTVVFEAGLGEPWRTWSRVLPHVASFAPTVAYSRAGIPESEPGPLLRTGHLVVDDLHMLLGNAGIPPPYVLVGHSWGADIARLYASQHPAEIAGLILVGAAHERWHERHIARTTAGLSPEERDGYMHWLVGGHPKEHVDLPATRAQLFAMGPLPPVPLFVLNPPCPEPLRSEWDEFLAEWNQLASLVPGGTLIVAERGGHYLHNDQPRLVIDTIRKVMETTRLTRGVA